MSRAGDTFHMISSWKKIQHTNESFKIYWYNNYDQCVFPQMDEFELEAVDLQGVKKVVVGHDGEGHGAGWFLEKVTITNMQQPDQMFYFDHNRWGF